jgi:hypothetical protein
LSSSQEPTDKERADIEYHDAKFTLASILLTTDNSTRIANHVVIKTMRTRLTEDPDLVQHPHSSALAEDITQNIAPSYRLDNWNTYGAHDVVARGQSLQYQYNNMGGDYGYVAHSQSIVNVQEQKRLRGAWLNSAKPMPLLDNPASWIQPYEGQMASTSNQFSQQGPPILSPVPEISDTTSAISSLPTVPQTPRRSPSLENLLPNVELAQKMQEKTLSPPSTQAPLLRLKNFLKEMRGHNRK